MSDIDEETEYIVGEVAESPQPENVGTKTLEVIWDDDKIERYSNPDGKRQWKCLWCGRSFQHWNATKALLHITKKPGDIRNCSSNMIDDAHKKEYLRLYQKQASKKSAKELAKETKKKPQTNI